MDRVSSQGGSLGVDLSGAAQKHLESEFGHNEARRLLAGINSGTLGEPDQLRVMDSMSRFGDQQAKLYAAQFTRDDLRGTYGEVDKPQLDTGSVPGAGHVRGFHGNNVANIGADAEGRGIPQAGDIGAVSANRQATVSAEGEAMRNKLEQEQHLMRTHGNERQEQVENNLDQSATGAVLRKGYEASPVGRGTRKNSD